MHFTSFEYKYIRNVLKNICPAWFLVFGVGYDSGLWLKSNLGGETLFLEDNSQWLSWAQNKYAAINAKQIRYNTKSMEWRSLIDSNALLEIENLPLSIFDFAWNCILVDGPDGRFLDSPGRVKSIFLASKLAKTGTHLFIHDCDRELEKHCCDRFFDAKDLVAEFHRLRHYRVDSSRI